MMKMFALDVTDCTLPEFWGTLPKIIYATPGRHDKDFDVADASINNAVWAIFAVLGNNDTPAGFNVHSIPVGAKITRMPDVEGDDYDW